MSGCLHTTSLVGPTALTIATGNITQAGLSYTTNVIVENETGKTPLGHVSKKIEDEQKRKKFNTSFQKLVKKRIQNTRQKLLLNQLD